MRSNLPSSAIGPDARSSAVVARMSEARPPVLAEGCTQQSWRLQWQRGNGTALN
jgi:hypothetical protein